MTKVDQIKDEIKEWAKEKMLATTLELQLGVNEDAAWRQRQLCQELIEKLDEM